MNQGQLGSKAFDTSMDAGRTKIKNIELGRQTATKDDLNKLALALGVGINDLMPGEGADAPMDRPLSAQQLSPDSMALFPGLTEYFDLLNKAVQIQDHELIGYISHKISELFAGGQKKVVAGN